MPQIIEVTCPHCNQAFQMEMPEKVRKPHGQLAGIAIEDMTDEQLKREITNATSVLYKATKRGSSEETIAKAQARLDAAKALRDERKAAAKAAAEDEAVEVESEPENAEDTVYSE